MLVVRGLVRKVYSGPPGPVCVWLHWGLEGYLGASCRRDVCAGVSHLDDLRIILKGAGILSSPEELQCVTIGGLEMINTTSDVGEEGD